MKRNFPENSEDSAGYSDQKMSRLSNEDMTVTEMRFLIPCKAAGVIIGKGGETVRDIREKYEIKVNIPDSSGPERVLQISGRTNAVMEALEVLLTKAKDCLPASEAEFYIDGGRSRGRNSKNSRSDGHGDGADDFALANGIDLRMLLHQSQAGGVIGRGGERIKELREQVNLKHVKIYQNTCPSSTDRVIQMVGEIPKVIHCVQSVMEMVQTFQIRGSEQHYDARNYDESQALGYGGWLSKGAFKVLQDYGGQGFPAPAPMPQHHNPNTNSAMVAIATARAQMMSQGTQPPPSRFMPAQGGMPRQHVPPMGGNMMMMPPHQFMVPGGGPPPRQPNRMPGGSGNNQMNLLGNAGMDFGAPKTIQVSVPNSYMGAIMGRAGGRIRSIREESGADIRVHEPDKNGGDRVIDITGTQQQIAYAQQLLKSCVILYHDKK